MVGRWKNIVATTIAAALYSGSVAAEGPAATAASATALPGFTVPAGFAFGAGAGELRLHYSPERLATAGATLRGVGGWTATLFVSSLGRRDGADDDLRRLRSSTLVNGRVVHRLTKDTRLVLDVFNVFNQPAAEIDHFAASRLTGPATHENFLFHPGEPRGFRLRLRTTF